MRFSELPAEAADIFFRQIAIEQEKLEVFSARQFERFAACPGGADGVILLVQHAQQHVPDCQIIVYDQNSAPYAHADSQGIRVKKYPVAGRGREPSHRERWVAANSFFTNGLFCFTLICPLLQPRLTEAINLLSESRATRRKDQKVRFSGDFLSARFRQRGRLW